MTTAIEQAISYLLQTCQPITVSNVLPLYLQFAGWAPTVTNPVSVTAIVSFERAMDKHPVAPYPMTKRKNTKTIALVPLLCKRLYHAEVEQLRKDYWEKTMEWGGAFGLCSCAACGRITQMPSSEDLHSQSQASELSTKKKHPKRKSKRRVVRPVNDVLDPYGPSTSARCL